MNSKQRQQLSDTLNRIRALINQLQNQINEI